MYPFCFAFLAALLLAGCSDPGTGNAAGKSDSTVATKPAMIKEEALSYPADAKTMNGHVAYKDTAGKHPAVLVVHEWWGLNDYAKSRARQLAELGYVALAVDMFGGKTAANPQQAQSLAEPFYKDPSLTKTYLEAAMARLKTLPQVDTNRIAAIGYCYGGYTVLNAAKLGADLDGVVVFHGNLSGATPQKGQMKGEVLVLHGGADPFVPEKEVTTFRKQMDSVGAKYDFRVMPGATHAFTNPGATEMGKKFNLPIAYNEQADKQSWEAMKEFLERVVGK